MHVTHKDRSFAIEQPTPRMTFMEYLVRHVRIGDEIDAHVDHCRSGPDERSPYEPRPAERSHQNVGRRGDPGKILRAGVTDRHGGMAMKEEHRHRFADDIAPADDDSMFSGDVNAAAP
jgi:hypothetical protein